jgi:hypothetical protein
MDFAVAMHQFSELLFGFKGTNGLPRCGSMHRNIASTVDGCSYSFLCVETGSCSRYSSACDDDADIVVDVGL